MNIEEIRARIAAIRERLQAIHTEAGSEDLTGEIRDEWESLESELGQRNTELTDAERTERERVENEERDERLRASRARWQSTQVGQKVTPWDGGDVRQLARGEARDKALSVLDSRDHVRHLDTGQMDQVDRLLRQRTPDYDPSYVARMLLLSEAEHYRSAWQKLVTQSQPVLTSEEARAVNAFTELRAMAGGTDTAGGYGVPVLIDPTIILTGQGSLNPFRKISRVENVTTDAWRGVSTAGVNWSYDAEASAVSDDSPTLAQPVVNVHEARGFIPFSIRVGQDYPGFAEEMSKLLAEGYDELQANKHAVGAGDGSNEPYGILTALDANTNVEVVVTTDGSFGGVDISKVWGALPDRYKANSTWVMSTDVGDEVSAFGNGNNPSFFTTDLTGVIEKIKNRPIEWSSYFPAFTATTGASNLAVVGDFRNYLIAQRVGMTVEFIPHLFDQATGRPSGQRGWFAYARDGADSINDLAFRLLQNQ